MLRTLIQTLTLTFIPTLLRLPCSLTPTFTLASISLSLVSSPLVPAQPRPHPHLSSSFPSYTRLITALSTLSPGTKKIELLKSNLGTARFLNWEECFAEEGCKNITCTHPDQNVCEVGM